jgi:hypothetical protein
VTKHRYVSATGELELSVAAALRTRSSQTYSYDLTFVVVLTGSTVARFTPVSASCVGTASCRITRSLSTAVPTGMHYIGLASQNWDLGSNSGPLLINTVGGHTDKLAVSAPAVNVEYLCVLQDARAKNRMFCEWGAKVVAFDPGEMEQNASTIFPQYTFASSQTTNRALWTENHSPRSGTSFTGFLDAFEGLAFIFKAGTQNAVWWIEASATSFGISTGTPRIGLTSHGIFLGTGLGNSTTAQPYAFQESRALGFLR